MIEEVVDVSTTTTESDRVVIAVDPHKASWTAAAVDRRCAAGHDPGAGQPRRATGSCAASPPAGPTPLGDRGRHRAGCTAGSRLSADGIDAVDVPAKLATRVRMLSTGHGRKNDDADAVSVGDRRTDAAGLRSAAVDEAVIALRALVEHRDDVVNTRTQTVNRLHVLLTRLLPGGAPRQLDADTAAQLLRTVRPAGDRASHPSAAGRRAHR